MNYVCIEGVDGCGKTTLLLALTKAMREDNIQFVLTKEPGGPAALRAEGIDDNLGLEYESFRTLCVDRPDIPQLVKRALYKADSFYNWLTIVQPNILAGRTVISDRSWISDLAYGVAVAKLNMGALLQFNLALIPEQQAATRVIYLKCDEATRAARLTGCTVDAADSLAQAASNELAKAYELALDQYVADYITIDTSTSLESCVAQAKAFVYAGITK